MQIFYCNTCGLRVSEDEIESGRATRVESRTTCANCQPAQKKPSRRDIVPVASPARKSSSRTPVAGGKAKVTAGESPPAATRKPVSVVLMAAAGLIALLSIAGLYLWQNSSESPTTAGTAAQTVSNPPVVVAGGAPTKPVEAAKLLPAKVQPEKADPLPTRTEKQNPPQIVPESAAQIAFDELIKFEGIPADDFGARAARLDEFLKKYNEAIVVSRAQRLLNELRNRPRTAVKPPFDAIAAKWHSWDMKIADGTPQAAVNDESGQNSAELEFYESANDNGVEKGEPLNKFNPGPRMDDKAYSHVEKYWSLLDSKKKFLYAGKSTVDRGKDDGETGAAEPLGVRDFQMLPPENNHLAVAAFIVPLDGAYALCDLGARRVSDRDDNARLRCFDHNKVLLAPPLLATRKRNWVTDSKTYYIGELKKGDRIYFGVDRAGNAAHDATEVSWTIELGNK